MKSQFHILNGDCLKEQFPESINGDQIIMRECLVDGAVTGNSLKEFYNTRAQFICSIVKHASALEYQDKVVSEFEKIQSIPEKSDIYLWFEDDLFCQVNMWFVMHLLYESHKSLSVFLVRPDTLNQYGFGGLNETELKELYEKRMELAQFETLSELWKLYQENNLEGLIKKATQLEDHYPFIKTAVQAHIERIPTENNLGKPKNTLLQIINELNTTNFKTIFQEFSKREPIYGFRDLQVQRLLDELNTTL